MIDHQYKENGARKIYSDYNQMEAYCECYPDQSKMISYRHFHQEIGATLKIPDKVLAGLVSDFFQDILMLILSTHT